MGAATRAWLVRTWEQKFSAAIEMMTGSRPEWTASAGTPSPDAAWYEFEFKGLDGASLFVGALDETWHAFGQAALQAAGIPDASAADANATALEILSQAASGLAAAIAETLQNSTSASAARPSNAESLSPIPPDQFTCFRSDALVSNAAIWFACLPVEGFSAPTAPALQPGTASNQQGQIAARSKTFDLLLEVELPVSVSFGRAQLPLRDVLKLNSGSIVELNRTVSEPVDIIVNNCVIARGEVVVVDGNYGVRIQQVISKEERLRTLS